MKTRVLYMFLSVLFVACDALAPQADVFIPVQNDAAVLKSAKYISHTPAQLILETEIIVLNSFYRGFDNDYLLEEDFRILGEGVYDIESFEIVSTHAPEPSCIFLLIDQSGSYLHIDPYNTRSQVLSKFVTDVESPNSIVIGAAAREGKLTEEPLEISSEQSSNKSLFTEYIYNLSERTGGLNAVIDATDQALDNLVNTSCTGRKALVLLTHSVNPNNDVDLTSISSKAQANGISVTAISFGDGPDPNQYASVAIETGGLSVVCPTEKEINKVFSELQRLINGKTTFYRLRIKFTPTLQNLLPGSETRHSLQITDPYSQTLYPPVFVNFKIPS